MNDDDNRKKINKIVSKGLNKKRKEKKQNCDEKYSAVSVRFAKTIRRKKRKKIGPRNFKLS